MTLSVSDIQAILAAEKSDALSAMQASKLSEERTRALDYYMGDMSGDMPAPTDRSRAVSSDVADTVEGMMPSMMEIFAAGDEVVQFNAVGPEDEDAAQQESEYINHIFMEKNPGFLTLYSIIKDALLSKVGIVKIWWDESEKEDKQEYEGITDDALALLMADPEAEVVVNNSYAIGQSGEPDDAGAAAAVA